MTRTIVATLVALIAVTSAAAIILVIALLCP